MKTTSPKTAARARRAAFTLPEMLVAAASGGIMLAAVAMLSVYSSRSFVALGNYMELDQSSRNALDQLSRDIRDTRSLVYFQTNVLVFLDTDGYNVSYSWSPSTKKLTTTRNGVTKTLLTQCDFLRFNISQRNPIPNQWAFYSASNNAARAKLVDVSWRCSRSIFGKKVNTESVQTAKIVIRN